MRIAVLSLEYPPRILGGAGITTSRLAAEVAKRGCEVHVFSPGESHPYRRSVEQGVCVHRLPCGPLPRWKILFFWMSLPRWFGRISKEEGRFDLVHSSGIADLTLRRTQTACPRIVTIYHLASSVVKLLKPSLWKRLSQPGNEIGLGPVLEAVSIRRADWIVTISEFSRLDILSRFALDPGGIRVIPLGTDLDGYQFPPKEIARLRKDVIAENVPMVLFVGRLEPRKGLEDLLDAFSMLASEHSAQLVVIGSGDASKYALQAERLGIRDKVTFRGFVPSPAELKKYYAACDLVVIPSVLEGFGLVALEARAAGKFTVAYRAGGLPEVVPERAGYLVPPGDRRALAEGMARAFREPHGHIPRPKSWSEVGEEYFRFYGEVIPGRGME